MKILNNYQALGDIVNLQKTHEKHMDITGETISSDDISTSFGQMLNSALKKVNTKQVKSDELTNQMITNPNDVNVHEVMIAAQEAQMSLNFLKQIRDRVVRAYQDIINMR